MAFLILLDILGAKVTASIYQNSSWKQDDKLVAAYYFYWYDVYSDFHFVNPDGSDAIQDHPPKNYLENYSYTEVSWHRRELQDMMAAQIDIVLPVYWGSDWDLFWSIPGLMNLVVAMEELITEGHAPPKIGMFYDTTAVQYQNGGVPPDITTSAGKALFYSMIADFFNVVPKHLWAMIDDRPIIYLYYSDYVSAYNQSTINYVKRRFKKDFGAKPYIVREASWHGVNTAGKYYWGVALNGPMDEGKIGSVGPGYDETATQRSNPRTRDRECGEFYNSSWEEIINSDAMLVSIETWNEWHEATEIAPSREYERNYINLTTQNILRWKSINFSTEPFVWIDLGRDSYLWGLKPINCEDGSWLVKKLTKREAAYPDNKTTPPSYYIYLDVNNAFVNASHSEVWVTVEYYDGGTDQWWLDYNSSSDPYKSTPPVVMQNTGQWKRHTFYLTDANFDGGQNCKADLRLSDGRWLDGETNYFGRIWIGKSSPSNQPPDLVGLDDLRLRPGKKVKIKISATDPDGDSIVLAMDNNIPFATLINKANGKGILHLKPKKKDIRSCPYRITVTATDTGNPVQADAVTFWVTIKK